MDLKKLDQLKNLCKGNGHIWEILISKTTSIDDITYGKLFLKKLTKKKGAG